MPAAIQVERDPEGIRMAVFGLFEESFQRDAIETAMRQADRETREAVLDDLDGLSLSPGYYKRACYLLDLATQIELGVQYHAADLSREDVMGLRAVKTAKSEFEYEHPCCSCCGVRQDNRFAPACKGCSVPFRRGGD